jgi:diguanylate cyclase (GGDEF)-like protein
VTELPGPFHKAPSTASTWMPFPLLRRAGEAIVDALLGTEPARRITLLNTVIAMALMHACWGTMWFLAMVDIAPAGWVLVGWLTSVVGLSAAYAAIRLGYSRRFADPALTSLQIYWAVLSMAASYGMGGAGRGAAFPVLLVTTVFSMFKMTAGAVARLVAFSLVLVGSIGFGMVAIGAPDFRLEVEIANFIVLSCTLTVVALLSVQLSRLRGRERAQRLALRDALRQISDLATRDELTGLVNRRQMQSLLDAERERCLRARSKLWVALIDLDHFKRINDLHGHASGDQVLRVFADTALQVCRKTDVLARWGGEEFVLMLVGYERFDAHRALERLRQAVGAVRVPSTGEPIAITLSAGLAEMKEAETITQLLGRADRLLYAAKDRGRNRVVDEAQAA